MNEESWNDLAERHADELARLAAKSDDEIDFSDIPEQDPEDWREAKRGFPFRTRENAPTVHIDPDVIAWFRDRYPRYQTAMNAALRSYMETHTGEQDDPESDLRETA